MKPVKACFSAGVVALCLLLTWAAAHAEAAGSSEIHGLLCITSEPIPTPEGTTTIPLPGSDFETVGKNPPGWDIAGRIVAAADAPQGKAYCRFNSPRGGLHTPGDIPIVPGRPYFVSLWLKSAVETRATFTFTSDERNPSFFPVPLDR